MAETKFVKKLRNWLSDFWIILDEGKITRRITLMWMLWITTEVFWWAMEYAEKSTNNLESAAILGAILTPLAGLQAAIFAFYRTPPTPIVVKKEPDIVVENGKEPTT